MPTPKTDESRDDYIRRCIPAVIGEGTTDDNEQAAAICHAMWNKHEAEKESRFATHLDLAVKALTVAAKARKAGAGWLVTRKQMGDLCPTCGDTMGEMGIEQLDVLRLKQMPAPLKEGLCAKFGEDEGFFRRCMKSSLGDFDPEQEAFCAWLHHECIGTWPGEKESKEAQGISIVELTPTGEQRLTQQLTAAFKRVFPWLGSRDKEGVSLDALRDRIWRAFSSQFNTSMPGVLNNAWVIEVFTDHAIVESGQKFFHASFVDEGDRITFASPMEWMEVERLQRWIHKSDQMKHAAVKGEKHPWHTGVPGQRGGSASSGGGGTGGSGGDAGSTSGGGESGSGSRGSAIEAVYRQSDRLTKMSPKKRSALVSALAQESAADLKRMGQWVLGMQTATQDRSTRRNLKVMEDMLVSALDAQSSKEHAHAKEPQENSPVQPSEGEIKKVVALFERLLRDVDNEDESSKAGARHSKQDNDEIQAIHDKAVWLGAECPMVMKQTDGVYRWVLLSSNAFEDTDGEIVSRKALAQDVEFSDLLGDYGTLDWWHVPALALGVCDFRALHGDVLVESGTFHDSRVGEAVSKKSNDLQVSLTFFHPRDEPDGQGVFNNIRTSARALLPKGRAANLLTAVPAVTEKESIMAGVDLKDKFKEFTALLGGDEALILKVVESAEAVEKQAREMGLRRKQASPPKDPDAQAALPAQTPPATQKEGDKPTEENPQAMLAAALKEAMAPFADRLKAIEDHMAKQAAKEAGASEANAARVAEANKQIAEHQKALAALAQTVKELTGEQPRGVQAFLASADPSTVIASIKEGEGTPQTHPIEGIMTALGIGMPPGAPVQQPGAQQ